MPRVKAETVKKTVKDTKTSVKSAAPKKEAGLSVPVYSLEGKEEGSLELPKELFGVKVNKPLLAQAVRVYRNNQKAHFSHTQTRSEVTGSTRKIYRQKGTGGARHGSRKAPIFVGGGVALGPKYRKVVLDLPKKMKRAALLSALSVKFSEGEIIGASGLEKASGKTAQMDKFVKKVNKKNILLVTGDKNETVFRGTRNLPNIEAVGATQLNVFEVLKHQTLMLTKEAITGLQERAFKKVEEDK